MRREDPAAEPYVPYASGFDVVWIGSASDIRFAYVAGSRAYLITHSRGALFGPDFGSLVSFGADVPERVFHADETAVYAFTRENDLVAIEPGRPPRTLFHAPFEADRWESDANAFYLDLIEGRERTPNHRDYVWRVPKRGGEAKRLFATNGGEMVTGFHSDGGNLLLYSIRTGPVRFVTYRIPVAGGAAPEELPCVDAADSPRRHDRDRMADFDDPDGRGDCQPCGSWADADCVRCDGILYRAPKARRSQPRELAYRAGRGLAVAEDSLYWFGTRGIVARPRAVSNETCDEHDFRCEKLVVPLDVMRRRVHELLADGTDLYFLEEEGTLVRASAARGTANTIASLAPIPRELLHGFVPPRWLALSTDYVYALDAANGSVVKVPKAGGDPVRFATRLDRPLALTIDEDCLYVLGSASSTKERDGPFELVVLDRSTGAAVRKDTIPGGQFLDMVTTRASTYVAFEDGDLYRHPKAPLPGGRALPVVDRGGYEGPAFPVEALAARGDRLLIASRGKILELVDGTTFPTVLVSRATGRHPAIAVSDAAVYFTHDHQMKWEVWTELGVVEAPRRSP